MIAICGGATFGNWDTGSEGIASSPARVMKIATTQARLGRLMKNLDMAYSLPARAAGAAGWSGISSAFTILWAVPGSLLSKQAAAAGIALISTIGGSAGVVAPVMVGHIKAATGSFAPSLHVLSGALLLAALLMLVGLPRAARPVRLSA